MFQNTLKFFKRAIKNSYAHISRFLDMCTIFEYLGVFSDATRLRLFPYTLRDSWREWLDTFPSHSITTWDSLKLKILEQILTVKDCQVEGWDYYIHSAWFVLLLWGLRKI